MLYEKHYLKELPVDKVLFFNNLKIFNVTLMVGNKNNEKEQVFH